MEKLYKDKFWLFQKYCTEILSTLAIGKICKVNAETIRTWLIKNGIKIRNTSEAKLEWLKKK